MQGNSERYHGYRHPKARNDEQRASAKTIHEKPADNNRDDLHDAGSDSSQQVFTANHPGFQENNATVVDNGLDASGLRKECNADADQEQLPAFRGRKQHRPRQFHLVLWRRRLQPLECFRSFQGSQLVTQRLRGVSPALPHGKPPIDFPNAFPCGEAAPSR
eukprot:TRINITY_DN35095_c0_g1_i1.p2 TRINITY_DN35095_c0_g1~~TRINITY_DN35095_c0_g1_i1.p2  ORF type:complete len:161 (+),score=15.74 TRINITY_DN35095_c0_g1_i1:376-858(+)